MYDLWSDLHATTVRGPLFTVYERVVGLLAFQILAKNLSPGAMLYIKWHSLILYYTQLLTNRIHMTYVITVPCTLLLSLSLSLLYTVTSNFASAPTPPEAGASHAPALRSPPAVAGGRCVGVDWWAGVLMSRPPPPPPAKPLAERPPAERTSGSGLIGMLRRARWWVAEVISAGSVESASRACSGGGLGFGFGL